MATPQGICGSCILSLRVSRAIHPPPPRKEPSPCSVKLGRRKIVRPDSVISFELWRVTPGNRIVRTQKSFLMFPDVPEDTFALTDLCEAVDEHLLHCEEQMSLIP